MPWGKTGLFKRQLPRSKRQNYLPLIISRLVGARGFEPPTPCSRSRCATRLRYAPTVRGQVAPGALECKGESCRARAEILDRRRGRKPPPAIWTKARAFRGARRRARPCLGAATERVTAPKAPRRCGRPSGRRDGGAALGAHQVGGAHALGQHRLDRLFQHVASAPRPKE